MEDKMSYSRLLEINPDYIVDIIYDMNINGPISQDYIRPIADALVEDIAQDIYESADRDEWSVDDVRLAFGRVLVKRLGIEI